MRSYRVNSPQAMARFIAMFMITDGQMDERELDTLEKIMAYDLLGLSRKQFTQVLVDYCDDISDEAEQDGTIHLIDRQRIDALLEEVADRGKRLLTCALAMDVAKADGDISPPEMALLRHLMQHWDITLADIEASIVKTHRHAGSAQTQNALD
ncbi:TerB family tellurite resistance protein [Paludibacterium purpuratum]|uniref:Tellurite resistance protein TerB n=1 Tax=Paludibacterium purpuratum TaxID=1144873 RepID=A0A4R7AYK1_9NEIS|nr:TerB family tellurite resistance protein [Paludibacterium purpuratum]TDR73002.1 tellurite resistance protein TerB [Paludibacterium purpuratum]